MAKTSKKYTYVDFALDAKTLATGGTIADLAQFTKKADALIVTQENKAEYNKANPKKSTAKGASSATKEKANILATALTSEYKTGAELNAELGTEFTVLEIANALKFVKGVENKKVAREVTTVSKAGNTLTGTREYTGYRIVEVVEEITE